MIDLFDIISADPKAEVKRFKKGDIIQREGESEARTFYIKKGLLRSYTIDSNGKQHIFMFAPENWIIADLEALQFNEPVHLFIDCLEDTEVISFNKDCLFKDDFSRDVLAQHAHLLYRRIGRLQRRVLMLMGSPAMDRYLYFLKIYPELANRVPQHMVATYLGIAPQTLSTLRNRIARSK